MFRQNTKTKKDMGQTCSAILLGSQGKADTSELPPVALPVFRDPNPSVRETPHKRKNGS